MFLLTPMGDFPFISRNWGGVDCEGWHGRGKVGEGLGGGGGTSDIN